MPVSSFHISIHDQILPFINISSISSQKILQGRKHFILYCLDGLCHCIIIIQLYWLQHILMTMWNVLHALLLHIWTYHPPTLTLVWFVWGSVSVFLKNMILSSILSCWELSCCYLYLCWSGRAICQSLIVVSSFMYLYLLSWCVIMSIQNTVMLKTLL